MTNFITGALVLARWDLLTFQKSQNPWVSLIRHLAGTRASLIKSALYAYCHKLCSGASQMMFIDFQKKITKSMIFTNNLSSGGHHGITYDFGNRHLAPSGMPCKAICKACLIIMSCVKWSWVPSPSGSGGPAGHRWSCACIIMYCVSWRSVWPIKHRGTSGS